MLLRTSYDRLAGRDRLVGSRCQRSARHRPEVLDNVWQEPGRGRPIGTASAPPHPPASTAILAGVHSGLRKSLDSFKWFGHPTPLYSLEFEKSSTTTPSVNISWNSDNLLYRHNYSSIQQTSAKIAKCNEMKFPFFWRHLPTFLRLHRCKKCATPVDLENCFKLSIYFQTWPRYRRERAFPSFSSIRHIFGRA